MEKVSGSQNDTLLKYQGHVSGFISEAWEEQPQQTEILYTQGSLIKP